MAEQRSGSEAPEAPAAPAAAPEASPAPEAAAATPAAQPTGLQPPEHWLEEHLSEDEADSTLGDNASSTASISSSILQYRTINGRTYHSDRGSNNYWGANDDQQNETLDIQHHVFTLLLGGKLHLAPLPEQVGKVLDLGTGTGLWAIDFGDQHPEADVIGTDLSPVQPAWVPPNVHFEIDDFTQDWTFAEESFDYIHARWLVGSVPDWDALMQQAYKTLKPGGWIEVFEFNGAFDSDDGSVTEKSAHGQWGYIFREGAKALGSKASFSVVKDELHKKAIEAAGFVKIQENHVKIPTSGWPKDPVLKEVGQFTRAALENDTEGTVGFMAVQLGWSKAEVAVYAAHMRKEIRNPAIHAYYAGCTVWAQKPLAG
ncbi:methyltransferase type 12 [Stachybotrys elegans]|uniref:Methyltransferase type 12 n=1 Tax=Stachybotrys elegans TaxID=80388 RepID=A0A8K0WLC2_9HYPO|nr:methyltransferase type 12 [Stachybotrys elegans]